MLVRDRVVLLLAGVIVGAAVAWTAGPAAAERGAATDQAEGCIDGVDLVEVVDDDVLTHDGWALELTARAVGTDPWHDTSVVWVIDPVPGGSFEPEVLVAAGDSGGWTASISVAGESSPSATGLPVEVAGPVLRLTIPYDQLPDHQPPTPPSQPTPAPVPFAQLDAFDYRTSTLSTFSGTCDTVPDSGSLTHVLGVDTSSLTTTNDPTGDGRVPGTTSPCSTDRDLVSMAHVLRRGPAGDVLELSIGLVPAPMAQGQQRFALLVVSAAPLTTFTQPQISVLVFENQTAAPPAPPQMSVTVSPTQTGGPTGPLTWRAAGDRIVVELPVSLLRQFGAFETTRTVYVRAQGQGTGASCIDFLPDPDPNLRTVAQAVQPPTVVDPDRDGASEPFVFRPSNGRWYAQGSSTSPTWGTTGDLPVPGEWDGRLDQVDPAVFRPSNGKWYVPGRAPVAWGTTGDVPVPGDWDGDQLLDEAVFRPSSGRWYVRSGGPSVLFGDGTAVPVPGEWDQDPDLDIAVWVPATGRWYVHGQSGSTPWGRSGDVPVPGQWDEDRNTDIAVYRPSTGQWFVQGQPAVTLGGQPGDVPVPGQWDADGELEPGIYRPSTGQWLRIAEPPIAWGRAGDVQVAANLTGSHE